MGSHDNADGSSSSSGTRYFLNFYFDSATASSGSVYINGTRREMSLLLGTSSSGSYSFVDTTTELQECTSYYFEITSSDGETYRLPQSRNLEFLTYGMGTCLLNLQINDVESSSAGVEVGAMAGSIVAVVFLLAFTVTSVYFLNLTSPPSHTIVGTLRIIQFVLALVEVSLLGPDMSISDWRLEGSFWSLYLSLSHYLSLRI
jgi:hypothetical protein